MDQPLAESSLRNASAFAKSLACLAAQRLSASVLISAGASALAGDGASRLKPNANITRSKAAASTPVVPRFTTVKRAPKAPGVFRSSARAEWTGDRVAASPPVGGSDARYARN